jgi:hypothetical protein
MHSVSLKSFKLVRLLPDSNRKDFRALHFIHFFYAFFLRRNVSDFVGINDPGSWLLIPGSLLFHFFTLPLYHFSSLLVLHFSTFSLFHFFPFPRSWFLALDSWFFTFPLFHSSTLSLFLAPGSSLFHSSTLPLFPVPDY